MSAKMSFKQRYGYPLWMPWAFVVLMLTGVGSFVAAFYTMNIRWFLATLVVVVLLGLPAKAHDHDRPDLTPWFESLRSRANVACCDGSDATKLVDVDWESNAGRYRVRIDGKWIDVPDSAVIDGPNLAGPAMVWPMTYLDGSIHVRCFMPGAMT